MNPNNKICFLHIGAPKTGSTALERFLLHNRDALKQLGWKYPDVSIRGFGHHDLAFLIYGNYPKWATPQDRPLEEMVDELLAEATECNRIILSSENFYLYPHPAKTLKILAQAGFPAGNVKVIVYVRRQDEIHMSWYNQAVKAQGYTGSIDECIAETHDLWDYEIRLNVWVDVFGQKNIFVRLYDADEMIDGDICADFLHLADMSPTDFVWPENSTNTRINRDILEFQRLINRLPLSVQEKRRFHKELIALTSAAAPLNLFDDSPLLTAGQRRQILQSYADANKRVARIFLGRECLFNEESINESLPSESYKGLTMEKLVYIMGWILAKQSEK